VPASGAATIPAAASAACAAGEVGDWSHIPAMTFRANNELALHVADPAAAATFYTTVLGCDVVSTSPDCIALTNGMLRLYLLRDPAPTHAAVVPSFDVADRAAALAQLQASGCTLVPVGPHANGEFYVRDPFGVVFDVVERALPTSGFTAEYRV